MLLFVFVYIVNWRGVYKPAGKTNYIFWYYSIFTPKKLK